MGGRSEAKGKIMLSTFIVTTVVVAVCYLTSAQFSHLSFPFHPFSQAPTTTATTTATVLVVADMMLTSWLVAGYHCLPIRIVFYPDDGDDDGFTTNVDWPSSRTW